MRTVPRWSAVLVVLAIAAGACAFTVRRALAPSSFVVTMSAGDLPADGFSSTEIQIQSASGRQLRGLQVSVDDAHRAAIESLSVDGDRASATVRTGVMPGTVTLRISASGFQPQTVVLKTELDSSDSFGDGTPDFLRLHDAADQQAFRRRFTLLAESQYQRGAALPAEINDCAALVRFAYREALSQHSTTWNHDVAPVLTSASEVRQYQYPYTPLAASLFRVRGGRFAVTNIGDGTFAQFADGETLWRYNTHFVGRSLQQARPGDLLFFRHDNQKMPFHAMIFVGDSQSESERGQGVIYHTGPNGHSAGVIRRLSLAEILNYPDARWRPIASNPGFLGIYRWNILRGTN